MKYETIYQPRYNNVGFVRRFVSLITVTGIVFMLYCIGLINTCNGIDHKYDLRESVRSKVSLKHIFVCTAIIKNCFWLRLHNQKGILSDSNSHCIDFHS